MNRAKEPSFICTSPSRSPRKGAGFTLVELMIVIAILGVLVALGVGPLLRSRIQANESAAMGNLRTLSSSAEAFRTTQNPPVYPANLAEMINANPAYLDASWGDNERQGYNYAYVSSDDRQTYSTSASPRVLNISGINSYCVDHTGVIRQYAQGGNIGNQAGCDPSGTPIPA